MEKLLLCPKEVAEALGICRQHFYEVLPELRARGLLRKRIGKRWKYVAASLPRVISKMEGDG